MGDPPLSEKNENIFIISGPSGSGKGTMLDKLCKTYPDQFSPCVSHTTRQIRPEEENGIHYHFIDENEMERKIQNGDFLEHITFSGFKYGTSKEALMKVQDSGKIPILEIYAFSIEKIKELYPNVKTIFIIISEEHLKKRLAGRGSEPEESLKMRLSSATKEIKFGKESGKFDIIIENDVLDDAFKKLEDFIFKFVKN